MGSRINRVTRAVCISHWRRRILMNSRQRLSLRRVGSRPRSHMSAGPVYPCSYVLQFFFIQPCSLLENEWCRDLEPFCQCVPWLAGKLATVNSYVQSISFLLDPIRDRYSHKLCSLLESQYVLLAVSMKHTTMVSKVLTHIFWVYKSLTFKWEP